MSQPDKIFTLRTSAGTEALAVDDHGNFYVRGEATESTDAVKTIMLEFAKQFLLERVQTAPVLTIRSAIPGVLRKFATAEDRESNEFKVALLQAGQRPLVEFNFEPGLINAHVLVGLLHEAAQQTLNIKAVADRRAAELAAAAPAPAPEAAPEAAPAEQAPEAATGPAAPKANAKPAAPARNSNKKKRGTR